MMDDDVREQSRLTRLYEEEQRRPANVNEYNGREIGSFKVWYGGKMVTARGCQFSVVTWILIIVPTPL